MIVKEYLYEFERGVDPKNILGIGKRHLIEEWLKKYENKIRGTGTYFINDDLTIDIKGSFLIDHEKIGNFPEYIQFGKVEGAFDCADNNMTSLKGCPEYVGGYFACDHNKLSTLIGCPKRVDGSFHCNENKKVFTNKYVRSLCFVRREVEDYRG